MTYSDLRIALLSTVSLLIWYTCPAAQTQTVDLTGTVVTPSSAPIEGAVVRGVGFDLADTTAADGLFRLQGTVQLSDVIVDAFVQRTIRQIRNHRGENVHSATLYCLNGRKARSLSLGRTGDRMLSGVAIVVERGRHGQIIRRRKHLFIGSRHHAAILPARSTQPQPSPAASAKTLTGSHYIELYAAGYRKKMVEVVSWAASLGAIVLEPQSGPAFEPGKDDIDIGQSNRRQTPFADVPLFNDVGLDGGTMTIGDISFAATVDARAQGVIPDDGKDDSQALQDIIDSLAALGGRRLDRPVALQLPSGTINLTREIKIDAHNIVICGRGSDPNQSRSTRIVLRPSETMRYDKIDSDGVPDIDNMTHSGNTFGWYWPGRGTFRVQTRAVHEDYESDYQSAPANRKDIYEGSVNFHWKSGLEVDQSGTYAARRGERVIRLDADVKSSEIAAIEFGSYVWVGAANTEKMYEYQTVPPEYWERLHMRTQIFKVVSVNSSARTITVDKPLELDLIANSAADGSAPIGGSKPYPSRVTPLTIVEGVGFRDFSMTLDLRGLAAHDGGTYSYTAAQATRNYGNMAPEYAMHGLVLKWAVNCWVENVHTYMTGSHPFVTEQVRNIEVKGCLFDGSWNKGGGGNGYFRLSRAWGCLVYKNILRNLRHLTLQWSSSGNVVVGNDLDCEINLHGGWERNNLIEMNVIRIPYNHSHTNCTVGCDHIDGTGAGETWYPIYWSAGAKAGKWSGATGPRNVFFNNIMKKQMVADGPYEDYLPYYDSRGGSDAVVFLFGWDRDLTSEKQWVHLQKNGDVITDWAGNELVDYTRAPNNGVNARLRFDGPSLFLSNAPRPLDPFAP